MRPSSEWPFRRRHLPVGQGRHNVERQMDTQDAQQANAPPAAIGKADEIAKTELLRLTGISYGQFYRWKRMGLIPEAWFRRRATFTGQGTFLPRRKVLDRIRRIQELKGRHSLEEIARMLSPDAARRRFGPDDLSSMHWISARAISLLPGRVRDQTLGFIDVLCLSLIEQLLARESIRDDQIVLAAEMLLERFEQIDHRQGERCVTIGLRRGEATAVLHVGTCVLDRRTQVAATVNLDQLIEEIKVRLRDRLE